VTPATSATFAQDPPSAKDRAETPRHSPTNALKSSSFEKAAGSGALGLLVRAEGSRFSRGIDEVQNTGGEGLGGDQPQRHGGFAERGLIIVTCRRHWSFVERSPNRDSD